MNCPKCNGLTIVVDTRSDNDHVYRRRLCRSCEYRFTTTESVSDSDGLRAVQRELRSYQLKKSLALKKQSKRN
jgi:transcriptional regulator NrdR family protein